MLDLSTRADLERLIEEGLPESLTLEYKAAAALGKSSEARSELVKDITALANSAGGQIIYGVRESDGLPRSIDGGVDASVFTPEWLGQVIETNATPRIQGLKITKISICAEKPDSVAYVVTVPQAITLAPHQNSIDKKYYRRYDQRAVPMHDYEIRDMLRRGRSPKLVARLTFRDGSRTKYLQSSNDRIEFNTIMENLSSEPALYSLFDFYFDKRLIFVEDAGFKRMQDYRISFDEDGLRGRLPGDEITFHRIQKTFITPHDFPLLQGTSITVGPPLLTFRIPVTHLGTDLAFCFGYSACTTGFRTQEFGVLRLAKHQLSILDTFETSAGVGVSAPI